MRSAMFALAAVGAFAAGGAAKAAPDCTCGGLFFEDEPLATREDERLAALEKMLAEAEVAFTGVAGDTALYPVAGSKTVFRQVTTFRVLRAVRGDEKGEVDIEVDQAEANCGIEIHYGRSYEIIARKTEDGLALDYCPFRVLQGEGSYDFSDVPEPATEPAE